MIVTAFQLSALKQDPDVRVSNDFIPKIAKYRKKKKKKKKGKKAKNSKLGPLAAEARRHPPGLT